MTEVVSELGVEPCGTQDQCGAAGFGDGLLPGELRASVYAQRPYGIVLAAGDVSVPSEDVIGGDVDQRGSPFPGSGSEVRHCAVVEQVRRGFVLFGFVDVGVCGAVDDHLHVVLPHRAPHGLGIGDVQLGDVGEQVADVARSGCCRRGCCRICRRDPAHFVAQLPVGSCDEHGYGCGAPAGSGERCASRRSCGGRCRRGCFCSSCRCVRRCACGFLRRCGGLCRRCFIVGHSNPCYSRTVRAPHPVADGGCPFPRGARLRGRAASRYRSAGSFQAVAPSLCGA